MKNQKTLTEKEIKEERRRSLDAIMSNFERLNFELEQWMNENPDSDGEVPESFLEEFEINKNELEEKIYGYYMLRTMNKSKANLLKDEAERIKGRMKRLENAAGYLDERVLIAVDKYGSFDARGKSKSKKVKTPAINVSKIDYAHAEVPNPDLLDKKYKTFSGMVILDSDDEELLKSYFGNLKAHIEDSGDVREKDIIPNFTEISVVYDISGACEDAKHLFEVIHDEETKQETYKSLVDGVKLTKKSYPRYS